MFTPQQVDLLQGRILLCEMQLFSSGRSTYPLLVMFGHPMLVHWDKVNPCFVKKKFPMGGPVPCGFSPMGPSFMRDHNSIIQPLFMLLNFGYPST